MQGRRLRLASGKDSYGERSEPENFFARGGAGVIIPPETAKLTLLSKNGGSILTIPPGVGACGSGSVWVSLMIRLGCYNLRYSTGNHAVRFISSQ
jgi:hypothetical protein